MARLEAARGAVSAFGYVRGFAAHAVGTELVRVEVVDFGRGAVTWGGLELRARRRRIRQT